MPQAPGNIEVTHEKFDLILPILKQENMLQLVLPTKYSNADEYPMPKNPEVSIKTLSQRIVAVQRFKGSCDHERCLEKLQKLHKRLVIDSLVNKDTPRFLVEDSQEPSSQEKAVGTTEPNGTNLSAPQRKLSNADAVSWVVARYHPPWACPLLRRNEVWIELSPAMPAVAALIDKAALFHTDVPTLFESVNGDAGAGAEGKVGETQEEGKDAAKEEEGKEESKEEELHGNKDELTAEDAGTLAEQARSLVELEEHVDASLQHVAQASN